MIDDLPPPTKKELQSETTQEDPSLSALKDYSRIQRTKDLLRTVFQGTLLGHSDEAIAKVRSLLEGGSYEEKLKEEREALERFKKAFPKTSLTGEIAGGVAGGLALGPIAGGISKAVGLGEAAAGAAGAISRAAPRAEVAKEIGVAASSPIAKPSFPIAKLLLSGAAAGAVEEIGKAEEPAGIKEAAIGAAKGALGGVVTGALVKGVPGAVGYLAGKLKTPGDLSKSGKMAYDIAKETGKTVTSEGSELVLGQSAHDLTEKLIGARNNLITKRFAGVLDRAEKEGRTVPLENMVLDNAKKYASFLSDASAAELEDIVTRSLVNNGNFSPTDAGKLKLIIGDLLNSPGAEQIPGMVLNLKNAKNAINSSLSQHLPEFTWLTGATQKLYQAIESVVNRGTKGITGPTGKEIYFSKIGKKIKPEEFEKSARGFIARGGLENSSTDTLKTTMDSFKSRIRDLEEIEQILIDKFKMPESESFFTHFGGGVKESAEQMIDGLQKALNYSALRARKIGQRTVTESSEIPVSVGEVKKLLKGSIADRLAITVGEAAGKYKAVDVLGGGTLKLISGVVEQGSKKINDLPNYALGPIAARLFDYPSTRPYASMLKEAEDSGNMQKRNTAIFALKNNPQTRQIFDNEVKNVANTILESKTRVMENENKRVPAEDKDFEMDEDYIDKRNRFLRRMESGSKLEDKEEFNSYVDSTGNRTIGHGFNLDAGGKMAQLPTLKNALNISTEDALAIYKGEMQIDKEQAEKLYNLSISKAEKQLNEKLKEAGFPKLNPYQRMALVSMVYNNPNLVGKQILSALSQGDMKKVQELISITSDHQADTSPGLPKRRRKEAKLFGLED